MGASNKLVEIFTNRRVPSISRVELMNVLVIFAVEEPVTAKTRNIRQACVQLRPEGAPFDVSATVTIGCDGMCGIGSFLVYKLWLSDGV
jgi:hypothetical protein